MTFFVVQRGQCATCKGSGMVPNEAWQQFFKEHPGDLPSEDAIYRWFEDRGQLTNGSIGKIPSEEGACGECEGEGVFEREVPLTDALKALCVIHAN